MEIGEQIKQFRMENGLSQQKLGDLLGVNKSHVSLWETGKVSPSKLTLVKINKVLQNEKEENIYKQALDKLVELDYIEPYMVDYVVNLVKKEKKV